MFKKKVEQEFLRQELDRLRFECSRKSIRNIFSAISADDRGTPDLWDVRGSYEGGDRPEA